MTKKVSVMFVIYILLAIFVIFAGFPFIWMLSTSLKESTEIFSIPPKVIPGNVSFHAYQEIWQNEMFIRSFFNSFKVAAITTCIAMLIAVLAGLGFGRFDFKGKQKLKTLILFGQLFPLVLLVTPYYSIMQSLGVLDSHTALYISYTSFVLPFSIYMLSNYFSSIPKELEEAAVIDGCSMPKALFRVTVPLAAPGIVATTINCFIMSWNEFLFAQTFIDSPSMRTLPIALQSFKGQYSTQWDMMMAASVISVIPVVIMFIFLQRQMVQGMTSGAVKG